MPNERRLRKRIDLLIHLLVTDLATGQAIGRVVDANLSGCLVLSDKHFVEGTPLELNVELPEPHEGQPYVYCKATVIRSEPAENPQFNLIALEITYMRHEDTKLFESVILALAM